MTCTKRIKRSFPETPVCCDFLLKATLFPWHFLWDILCHEPTPELQGCRPSLFIQVKDSNHTTTSATKRMKEVPFPKLNIAPEKLPKTNRKGSSSNHHFSGSMLNFGRVGNFCLTFSRIRDLFFSQRAWHLLKTSRFQVAARWIMQFTHTHGSTKDLHKYKATPAKGLTILTHLWQTNIRMKHPRFCSPTYWNWLIRIALP